MISPEKFQTKIKPLMATLKNKGKILKHRYSSKYRHGVRIHATKKANSTSQGIEVILIDYRPDGDKSLPISHFGKISGWNTIIDIRIGYNLKCSEALQNAEYDLELPGGDNPRLFLLSHPWSGIVTLSYQRRKHQIDLFNTETCVLVVDLLTGEQRKADISETTELSNNTNIGAPPCEKSSLANHAYYERLYDKFDRNKPIGLYVPRWHGVAKSTTSLFDQTLPIPQRVNDHPDSITSEFIESYAQILLASGGRHFVISGGDLFYITIIKRVLRSDSSIRFDQLWHSNYLQMGEAHDWNLLRHWLHELSDGTIHRLGVVKQGLEGWFQSLGIDAIHIPNIVPVDTDQLQYTKINDQIGIWLSGSTNYRKLPYAMLMASKLIPNVTLNASGIDDIGLQIISDLHIPFRHIHKQAIPRVQLEKEIKATGLTLYTTLSECSPMVPLESFALGVPCLIGPASHLFRDHSELHERLVVEHPLNPVAIREKAIDVLHNQHHILNLFTKEYYPDLKQQVDVAMKKFTE